MTQYLHSKRLPMPGAAKVLAAVLGLVAALSLGAMGQARAATPANAPATVTAGADRFSDRPHGFVSLAGGTTGGAGGKIVTVTDQASLAKYAAAEEPYIIRVSGSIAVEPFGSNIVAGTPSCRPRSSPRRAPTWAVSRGRTPGSPSTATTGPGRV